MEKKIYHPSPTPFQLLREAIRQQFIVWAFILGDCASGALPSAYTFELLFRTFDVFWWTLILAAGGQLISSTLFYRTELLKNIRGKLRRIEEKDESPLDKSFQDPPEGSINKRKIALYHVSSNLFFFPLELIKISSENFLLIMSLLLSWMNWGRRDEEIEFHDIDPYYQSVVFISTGVVTFFPDLPFDMAGELLSSTSELWKKLVKTEKPQLPWYAMTLIPLSKSACLRKITAYSGAIYHALWLTLAIFCYLPTQWLGQIFEEYPLIATIIAIPIVLLVLSLSTLPVAFKYLFFEGEVVQKNLWAIHQALNPTARVVIQQPISKPYASFLKGIKPLVKLQSLTLCNASFGIFAVFYHLLLKGFIKSPDIRKIISFLISFLIGLLMAPGTHYSQVQPAVETIEKKIKRDFLIDNDRDDHIQFQHFSRCSRSSNFDDEIVVIDSENLKENGLK